MAFIDALRGFFSPPPGLIPLEEERSLTFSQLWSSAADLEPANTIAGVPVSEQTAMNAPAVWACVRLISGAIAGLPLHAYRKVGTDKVEFQLPTWMDLPVPNNPNVSRAVHVQQVVVSLLLDGNAFVRFLPDVRRPVGMVVLDPTTVEIRTNGDGGTIYRVAGAGDLTPSEIMHIPYVTLPGRARGLNPVDAARETIGLALAAEQYGASYFGNGASLSLGVKFPAGVEPTAQQVADLKRDLKKQYVGSRKSHGIGILTGGAEFQDLASSNRDSQMVEVRQYQVEDIGRIYGVPPHMIGSQVPGAVSYASVEQRNIDFVTHGLQPVIEKLEDGYDRALPGPDTFFKFSVEGLLRGDHTARGAFYDTLLRNKVMLREEVRAKEDLPSLGALGFLETPNNNPPEVTPA